MTRLPYTRGSAGSLTRPSMAHRASGFYEVPCRHHPLGCPTALDRLGRAFGWYVVVGTIAYFAGHVLVATVR